MAVQLCPWCQSEIPVEEGQEPDKYCPVCDNEMDGYRTLRLDIGGDSAADEEEEEIEAYEQDEDNEGEEWDDALAFRESGPEGLVLEEAMERLLDEQEFVPECPNCREYMFEAGEQRIAAEHFSPRVPQSLGQTVLEAPFSLTLYVCPSCFATQTLLSESGREQIIRRLSEQAGQAGKQG
ncbi:hypothetical protein [Cohnella yongneupensis]|uniref:Uncharacterized protein n=1 Tax=Cohnella yongneupensis TaxID=425006 RepID=A0ABW0QW03_9BACL